MTGIVGISKRSLRLSQGSLFHTEEFTKIQTLFSALLEPANNAYTCMVAITRMQCRYAQVIKTIVK